MSSSAWIPTTGTYTVVLNPYASTGGATLTLTQNSTQALAVNTPLSVSSTIVGQVFDLTFSGTAGQVVSVAATSVTYPCYSAVSWSIVKPDGTNLTSSGLCANVGAFNNQTLPTTGTYTVVLNPHSTTRCATLTLTQNITQALAVNTPLSVSSTLAGQVFDLTFSGTAGQVVSVAATSVTYPCYSAVSWSIVRSEERRVGKEGRWGAVGAE